MSHESSHASAQRGQTQYPVSVWCEPPQPVSSHNRLQHICDSPPRPPPSGNASSVLRPRGTLPLRQTLMLMLDHPFQIAQDWDHLQRTRIHMDSKQPDFFFQDPRTGVRRGREDGSVSLERGGKRHCGTPLRNTAVNVDYDLWATYVAEGTDIDPEFVHFVMNRRSHSRTSDSTQSIATSMANEGGRSHEPCEICCQIFPAKSEDREEADLRLYEAVRKASPIDQITRKGCPAPTSRLALVLMLLAVSCYGRVPIRMPALSMAAVYGNEGWTLRGSVVRSRAVTGCTPTSEIVLSWLHMASPTYARTIGTVRASC